MTVSWVGAGKVVAAGHPSSDYSQHIRGRLGLGLGTGRLGWGRCRAGDYSRHYCCSNTAIHR